MSTLDLNEPVVDYIALGNEFVQLKAQCERAYKLEQEQKERALTKEENDFLASMPKIYSRAIEVTRILRRTNTGPAKVKAPKKATKKAEAQAKINDLLGL